MTSSESGHQMPIAVSPSDACGDGDHHLRAFRLSAIESALLAASADSASSRIFAVPLDDLVPGGNTLATTASAADDNKNPSLRPPLPTDDCPAAPPGVEQRQIFVGQLPIFVDPEWVVPLLNHARRLTTTEPSAPGGGAAVSSAVRRSSGARASPYALVTLENAGDVPSFRRMHRCVYLGQRYLFYCHSSAATVQEAPAADTAKGPVGELDNPSSAARKGRRKSTAPVDHTTTPLHELVTALTLADADSEAPETRARGLARACVVVGPANPPPPPQLLKPATTTATTKPAEASGARRRGGESVPRVIASPAPRASHPSRASLHGGGQPASNPPAYAHYHLPQQHQQHVGMPPSPLALYQPPPPQQHQQHQWFATSTPPPPPGAVLMGTTGFHQAHQNFHYEQQSQGPPQTQQPTFTFVNMTALAPSGVSPQSPFQQQQQQQQQPQGFVPAAYLPQVVGEGSAAAPPMHHQGFAPQQQQQQQHHMQHGDQRGFVAVMPVPLASPPQHRQPQPRV